MYQKICHLLTQLLQLFVHDTEMGLFLCQIYIFAVKYLDYQTQFHHHLIFLLCYQKGDATSRCFQRFIDKNFYFSHSPCQPFYLLDNFYWIMQILFKTKAQMSNGARISRYIAIWMTNLAYFHFNKNLFNPAL